MAVSARQTTAAPLATESVYVAVPAPTDISDQLRRGLNVLRKVAGFVSAAVTRRDGLVIFHTFRSAREAAALSAMAAAMAGAARSTGTELGQGLPESCVIRYESGVLLIQEAGPRPSSRV